MYPHFIRWRSRAAFTLIELLIVVAIIAILAAIAVPNFLEAQTRAKISRVKADLRTAATGLETYHIDQNQYPWSNINSWALAFGLTSPGMKPTLERLTTPIAYLNGGAGFKDPFKGKRQLFGPNLGQEEPIPEPGPSGGFPDQVYRYIARGFDTVIWDQKANQKAVWYMLESCGPKGDYHRLGNALNRPESNARRGFMADHLLYDATNGTVSTGGIWRAGGKGGKGDYFSDMVTATY